MAGLNSPSILRTKNHLSPKDIAKRTAALTLLLSTIAYSVNEKFGLFICFGVPLLLYGLAGIASFFGRGGGGGMGKSSNY